MKYAIVALFSVLTIVSVAFAEKDLPKIKYGEWESVTTIQGIQMPGMPGPQKSVSCIDEKQVADHLSQVKSLNMPGCDTPVLSQKGNAFSASVNCSMNGMTVNVSSETQIVSETETTTDVKSQMGPGMVMNINVKSRYLGPCS